MNTTAAPDPAAGDTLPSWNDGTTKQAIADLVGRATAEGSADFIPPAGRIAVFDNDGTLWTERPVYTQLAFALDRVKAMAPQHPEWATEEPFASLLQGNLVRNTAGAGHREHRQTAVRATRWRARAGEVAGGRLH